MNPANLANWTVTHVDWSEGKWHPRSYAIQDITPSRLHDIQVSIKAGVSVDESLKLFLRHKYYHPFVLKQILGRME